MKYNNNIYVIYMPTNIKSRAVVVVIVWQFDSQLPLQSVPITTIVVSLNPTQTRWTRYNIVLKNGANDLRQVNVFIRILWFSSPIKTYLHDIAEILLKVALNTTILNPNVKSVPNFFIINIMYVNYPGITITCNTLLITQGSPLHVIHC